MKLWKNHRLGLLVLPFGSMAVLAICYASGAFGPVDSSRVRFGEMVLATQSALLSEPGSERERARRESITQAARKWHDELLGKYPKFKPVYRDVPDEKNGYLQFLLLAERGGAPQIPAEIGDILTGEKPWNTETMRAWLSENHELLERTLAVAELPESSIKGIEPDRIFSDGVRRAGNFGKLLRVAGQLAFEEGDREASRRYYQAAMRLGNHFTDIEMPSMLGEVIASGIRAEVHESFMKTILPNLADDTAALKTWREVISRKEQPSSELARICYGEWNTTVRSHLLPALLGAGSQKNGGSIEIRDIDAFFATYTTAIEKQAAGFSASGPGRLDLSHAEPAFPEKGIDKKSLEMLHSIAASSKGIYKAIGIQVTRETMNAAAVSIVLKEEPPLDPVSGKPFVWDPESRMLSAPEGNEGVDPIRVP